MFATVFLLNVFAISYYPNAIAIATASALMLSNSA
jgi:hypothetical protein